MMEMKYSKMNRLLNGESFITREKGFSMEPLIKNNESHLVSPIKWEDCNVDDIVYCKVNGKFYTHLVKAKNINKGLLIGNYSGNINGWTKNVYGIVTILK